MCSDLRALHGAVLGAAVLLTTACARTDWKRSLADDHGGLESELQYWEGLESRILVTRHDALHGLLLLDGVLDEAGGYAERQAAAEARGWWTARDLPPNESVRVGEVAVAIAALLDLDGGLTGQLFGRTERAALRALTDEELLPPRSAQQGISGPEFLDLIARASDRMTEGRARP